jgi:hypothetical protein
MERQRALQLIAGAAVPFVLPAAAAAAEPRVVYGGRRPEIVAPQRAVDAPPAIVAIWFSQAVYGWGDLARVALVTTTNTALVEMRVVSYGRPLTKKALGQFDGVYRVPFLPPLLDKFRYALPFRFIVRNPAGKASSFDLKVPVG